MNNWTIESIVKGYKEAPEDTKKAVIAQISASIGCKPAELVQLLIAKGAMKNFTCGKIDTPKFFTETELKNDMNTENKWTAEADAELTRMYEGGVPVGEIMKHFSKPRNLIMSRVRALSIKRVVKAPVPNSQVKRTVAEISEAACTAAKAVAGIHLDGPPKMITQYSNLNVLKGAEELAELLLRLTGAQQIIGVRADENALSISAASSDAAGGYVKITLER